MQRKGIPCQEGQVLSPILNPRHLSSSLTPLRRNALWLLNQSQRVDAFNAGMFLSIFSRADLIWIPRVPGLTQRSVEIERGANERHVGERLGKITECFAGGTGLFRVQPQMIRVTQHLLEHQPRVVEPRWSDAPGARERFDEPECTDVERALLAP